MSDMENGDIPDSAKSSASKTKQQTYKTSQKSTENKVPVKFIFG